MSQWIVFARFSPLRALLAGLFRRPIADMRQRFDAELYANQIALARLRRQVSRAPELHYLLFGAVQRLTPAAGFDPVRFREQHPAVSTRRPFLAFARQGAEIAHWNGETGRPDQPGALLIDHPRGGGSSRYLDFYARKLRHDGFRTIRAQRLGQASSLFAVGTGDDLEVMTFDASLGAIIDARRVTRLVINHLIDLPNELTDRLPSLARSLGVGYELLLHDYYLLCPRVNLVDSRGRFCGLADIPTCVACLGDGAVDPAIWRAGARTLMAGAIRTVAPSADLARRMEPYARPGSIEIVEPETEPPPLETPERVQVRDGAMRVAMIGSLNRPKGFDVVEALARENVRRRSPLAITLVGQSIDDRRLRRLGVEIRGRYREQDLPEILDGLGHHLMLFPAIWPETWSFTLTHALRRPEPIAAFDIGAIADRLRRNGRGILIPLALRHDPARLLDRLLATAAARSTLVR